VEGFRADAAVERGVAPRTLEAYGRDLARFEEYLARRGVTSLAGVERQHVAGFAASLERQGLAARSRARMLVAVRRCLRHAGAAGAGRGDPRPGPVPPPPPPPPPPRPRPPPAAPPPAA